MYACVLAVLHSYLRALPSWCVTTTKVSSFLLSGNSSFLFLNLKVPFPSKSSHEKGLDGQKTQFIGRTSRMEIKGQASQNVFRTHCGSLLTGCLSDIDSYHSQSAKIDQGTVSRDGSILPSSVALTNSSGSGGYIKCM